MKMDIIRFNDIDDPRARIPNNIQLTYAQQLQIVFNNSPSVVFEYEHSVTTINYNGEITQWLKLNNELVKA